MRPGSIVVFLLALGGLLAGSAVARGDATSVNAAVNGYDASELTNRQLAGQRIVCGFSGRRAPQSLLNVIARGELAGVILFEDNIGGKASVQAMNRAIQATDRPPGLRQPVLISVDQEGGLVKRLPGPPKASAQVMGARGAKYSRSQGAATGTSLRSYGFNVDLAPVLDVAGRAASSPTSGAPSARSPGGSARPARRSRGGSRQRASLRPPSTSQGLARPPRTPTCGRRRSGSPRRPCGGST
jgi:beta-N-acetylhexosaminidase